MDRSSKFNDLCMKKLTIFISVYKFVFKPILNFLFTIADRIESDLRPVHSSIFVSLESSESSERFPVVHPLIHVLDEN